MKKNPYSKSHPKESVSINESAEILGVTRQAIYVAIREKKLRAKKELSHWVVQKEDLEDYRLNKYSRSRATYKGELLFDNEKGCYSIHQVAKLLGVRYQTIYYAIRIGMLKAKQKGFAWVIHSPDLEEYRKNHVGTP